MASLDDVPEANTLLIGIAPAGGKIPTEWRRVLSAAIERGMRIVSGLHEFLTDDPEFQQLASQHHATLVDVRKNNERDVATGDGLRDDCLRVLTVGQDCSVGKMVTSLEIANALKRMGHDAKFVATGQTGIMIEGDGCPVDCVVSDFLNGAVEKLIKVNQHHDLLLVEGQGSLSHPRYSPVTLGLLHGARPQGMILCYEAGRTAVHGMPEVPLLPLGQLKSAYEQMARMYSPSQFVGIAVNTSRLTAEAAEEEARRVEAELGLPACDVIRDGADRLATAVLELRQSLFAKQPAVQ